MSAEIDKIEALEANLEYVPGCKVCELIKARVPGKGCFIHDYLMHMLDHRLQTLFGDLSLNEFRKRINSE